MILSVCGFNHKSADLAARERFQIPRAELTHGVEEYQRISGAKEVAIVSTCNRVEFYRVVEHKSSHYEELIRFYQKRGVKEAEVLYDICYSRQGTSAVRHLFRVAAGLDSLVLGEDQIIHQLKEAYSSACAVNGPGSILHKIFHLSFQVSKKIRSQTCIAAGPRNIPSAAINMLDRKSGGVKMSKVLICGVNELTEILLKYLNRRGTTIILANRSLYQAQKLASGYEAKAVSLDAIDYWLSRVDAVFTATASTEYIITAKQLEKVRNKKEKLYLVDIAVPRNIDPEADKLPGVKLLDLQDLKKYLELSNSIRQEEVAKAEAMIEEQVNLYSLWRTKIMKQDKLLSLKQIINQTRKSELEKIKDRFRKGDLKALEAYSKAMTREFLRLAPYLWDEFELPARKEKS